MDRDTNMQCECFKALGFPCDVWDTPTGFRWYGGEPSASVLAAVGRIPADYGTFIATDLAAVTGLKLALSAEQFAALVACQKACVQEARAARYEVEADHLFFDTAYDVLDAAASLDKTAMEPWLTVKRSIKAALPYPTTE